MAKKVKYTSGVLCRDKGNFGGVNYVLFAKGVLAKGLSLDAGGLYRRARLSRWTRIWQAKDWRATYDLAPPRKGQAFECEVQL